MSRKRTGNLIVRILAVVILLVLLGTAIALIYRYTNGFNEDFKTFYFEYNGEKIFESEREMLFVSGTEAEFGVKYTFDVGDKTREYSVKIVPNEKESFQYTVGDRYKQWRAKDETADLSAYFGLKKEASSFTLTFPSGMTAGTVLRALYPGEDITVDADALKGKPLYRLEVSSYNKEITYIIDFAVTGLSVELDKDHVVFSKGHV